MTTLSLWNLHPRHRAADHFAGFLERIPPDVVIVMNQVFVEEIRSKLLEMNLSPDLLVVNT